MKMLFLVLAVSGLVLAGTPAAQANKRIALVVGNSDYTNIQALANPANDAGLMEQSLLGVDFEVITAKNVDIQGMRRAVKMFGRKLREAGKDAVGLFYYAGHGVQAKGKNYLLPLGAEITNEADLELEALTADHILGQMESAGNALNFVILDACRNNPFKSSFRSSKSGLARTQVQQASGALIAYAAAPGQVAADGKGENSPYTAALAKTMQEPGLTIEQVFKKVRVAVRQETGEQQTPWEESSILGDFYFVPKEGEPVPTAQAPAAPGASVTKTITSPSQTALELSFWETIKDSQDPAFYRAYLNQYPKGVFAGLAQAKLNALDKKPVAQKAEPAAQEAEPETQVAAVTDRGTDVEPEPEAAVVPEFGVEDFEDVLYALKRSNVRAGPGTSYDKVARLEPRTPVEVTGKVQEKNWYRIALAGGDAGYVFAPLLAAELPQQQVASRSAAAGKKEEQRKTFAQQALQTNTPQPTPQLTPQPVVQPAPQPTTTTHGGATITWHQQPSGQQDQAQPTGQQTPAKPADTQVAVGVYPATPGGPFRDCNVCPEMVTIQAGSFTMGSPSSESGRAGDEDPQHKVNLRSFAIGKHEVTYDEYDACVRDGGCQRSGEDKGWGRGKRPVMNVSWSDAKAYTVWLGRKTGAAYRLPSEAEWEYAARAGSTTASPWGGGISRSQANYRGGSGKTTTVGSYSANAWGLHDMLGNVWEWVEDCAHGSYSGAPTDGRAWVSGGNCGKRVLRGGSWNSPGKKLRSANRHKDSAGSRGHWKKYVRGFRVAKNL